MATLYVTEYGPISTAGEASIGLVQAVNGPPLAEQTVTITGTSAQSAAFSANTRLIRVTSDAVCSTQVGGQNPVATTSSQRHAIGVPEYFSVVPGDKIAVISNT